MEATAKIEVGASGGFIQEFQEWWRLLPDKAFFGVLLAGWALLFQFFGWTTHVAGRSPSLFDWMWQKWDDPIFDSSHGKLIPFAVLGLLWFRRERLVKSVSKAWWPGLFILAAALMIHILAYLIQQPRLSIVALFFGAWGLVGLVWGREILKVSFFPFFIFAFCVPMGGTFAQGVTLPLRLTAAKTTAFVAKDILDIAVLREGTTLKDPAGKYGSYDVAAACSGIRSFLALLAITTILSAVTVEKIWKRAALIALSIPLAFVCNVLRLTTIILTANAYHSEDAGKFADKWFGFVTYAIALGSVLLVGRLLREKPALIPS